MKFCRFDSKMKIALESLGLKVTNFSYVKKNWESFTIRNIYTGKETDIRY